MERTSHANFALRPDCSTMQFHNAFGDCQSQSEAIHFPRKTCIEAMKVLKDTLKLLSWDAFSAHPRIRKAWMRSPVCSLCSTLSCLASSSRSRGRGSETGSFQRSQQASCAGDWRAAPSDEKGTRCASAWTEPI